MGICVNAGVVPVVAAGYELVTGVCGAAANVLDGAIFNRGGRVSMGPDVGAAVVGAGDDCVCGAVGYVAGVGDGIAFCGGVDTTGVFSCAGIGGVIFMLRLCGRINRYNPTIPITTAETREK